MTNVLATTTVAQSASPRQPDLHFWSHRPLSFTRRMRQPVYPRLRTVTATATVKRGLLSRLASLLA